MKLKLLAGAALAGVFAASGAWAQDATNIGWYGAIDIGAHWAEGLNTRSAANESDGQPYHFQFHSKADWAGFARIGGINTLSPVRSCRDLRLACRW